MGTSSQPGQPRAPHAQGHPQGQCLDVFLFKNTHNFRGLFAHSLWRGREREGRERGSGGKDGERRAAGATLPLPLGAPFPFTFSAWEEHSRSKGKDLVLTHAH